MSVKNILSATSDDSAIFISVGSLLLQILIQASLDQQAKHVDIPIENITSRLLVSSATEQSGVSTYTVSTVLASTTGITCYVNAEPQRHKSVELVFESEDNASKLLNLLSRPGALRRNVSIIQSSPAPAVVSSHSEVDDNRQEQLDSVDPAKHSTVTNHHTGLIATAVKATSLISSTEPSALSGLQSSLQTGVGRSSMVDPPEHSPIPKSGMNVAMEHRLTSRSPRRHQKSQAPSQARRGQVNSGFEIVAGEGLESINGRTVRNAEAVDHGIPKILQRKLVAKLELPAQVAKEKHRIVTSPTQREAKSDTEYDFPISPTNPPAVNHSTKSAIKSTHKKTGKTKKTVKVTREAQTQPEPSKALSNPKKAQTQVGQPRSRRAAALDADKKIRGIDISNANGRRTGPQIDIHKRKRTLPIEAASNEIQRGVTETLGSAHEAAVAVESSKEIVIESTKENQPSDLYYASAQKKARKPNGFSDCSEEAANLAQKPSLVGSIASPQPNQRELERGAPQLQSKAPRAQMVNDARSGAAADESKVQMVSVLHRGPEREERVVPQSESQAQGNRLFGGRDPFASRLSAVIANAGPTNVGVTGGVSMSVPEGNQFRRAPQEAKHVLGRPSLMHRSRTLATPSLHTPDAGLKKPIQRSKRKAIVQTGSTLKKVKGSSLGFDGPRMSIETTPPLASRKTPIISFSTSGPRNQGIGTKARAKKSRIQVPVVQCAVPSNGKGKLNNTANEPKVPAAPIHLLEQQQQQQPHSHSIVNKPKQSRDLSPNAKPLTQSDQELHTERLGLKPSSQTTRVDHNGSPMPTRHLTNRHIPSPSHGTSPENVCRPDSDSGEMLGDGEDGFLNDADQDSYKEGQLLQPILSSTTDISQTSMPQVGAYTWLNTSLTKKQIPSLPQAPSVASALPVHYVHRISKLVNPHTEEAVIPSTIKDPSISRGTRLSHFAQLLQNASEKGPESLVEATAIDFPKKMRLSTDVLVVDDPERALVELSEEPRKSKPTTADRLSSPSSSSSSSKQSSEMAMSPTLVENQTETTPTQWKKALQPHQRNVLDVLIQISHQLLAHMIKSEDAFMVLIDDFRKGGNLLIDHLEKEHETENLAQTASTKALRQKVVGIYQKANADLQLNTSNIRGRTKDIEEQWEARQNSLMAKVNAALALHAA